MDERCLTELAQRPPPTFWRPPARPAPAAYSASGDVLFQGLLAHVHLGVDLVEAALHRARHRAVHGAKVGAAAARWR